MNVNKTLISFTCTAAVVKLKNTKTTFSAMRIALNDIRVFNAYV